MRVTVVNTVHAECGAVTATALITVLERLRPEVVFAEIPTSYAGRYRDGSHGNLESVAVAAYAAHHPVRVVPVDDDEPAEEFFRMSRVLFERIERVSRDYRHRWDRHTAAIRTGGLQYLNSDASVEAWMDITAEIRASIDWIREPELHTLHDSWMEVNASREAGMLRRISEFAAIGEHTSGVFLVGAAHRQSIVATVRSDEGRHRTLIEWQLDLPPDLFGQTFDSGRDTP